MQSFRREKRPKQATGYAAYKDLHRTCMWPGHAWLAPGLWFSARLFRCLLLIFLFGFCYFVTIFHVAFCCWQFAHLPFSLSGRRTPQVPLRLCFSAVVFLRRLLLRVQRRSFSCPSYIPRSLTNAIEAVHAHISVLDYFVTVCSCPRFNAVLAALPPRRLHSPETGRHKWSQNYWLLFPPFR
jgi:hypothetical protein